jgi:hypothetical protein
MRSLFTYSNSTDSVEIDPAAYTLLPYKAIWDRDKTKGKNKAREQLAYVYFMADYKSFFSNITEEAVKHKEVSKVVFGTEDYEIDEVIAEALKFYRKDIPISVSLLEDAKLGINALREYFRTVSLTEVDAQGKVVHDSSKLSNNLKNLYGVIDGLESLEQKVRRDVESSTTIRGGREKGIFEDDN